MERLERIFILHRMLSGRRVPVPRQEIEQALECSRATVTRTIATMRDWLGAPIVYDAERNGYRYDDGPDAAHCELPGMWLRSEELQALLLISGILEDFTDGQLTREMAPLKARLATMLRARHAGAPPLKPRLRSLAGRRRPVVPLEGLADIELPAGKAVLRFSARVADGAARERWHPRQSGHRNADGSYELTLPCSDPEELLPELLWHGAEVEVLAPRLLREALAARLERMRALYAGDPR